MNVESEDHAPASERELPCSKLNFGRFPPTINVHQCIEIEVVLALSLCEARIEADVAGLNATAWQIQVADSEKMARELETSRKLIEAAKLNELKLNPGVSYENNPGEGSCLGYVAMQVAQSTDQPHLFGDVDVARVDIVNAWLLDSIDTLRTKHGAESAAFLEGKAALEVEARKFKKTWCFLGRIGGA